MNPITPQSRPPFFSLLWTVILLAPIAWAIALGTMLPLTDWACEHGQRSTFFVMGGGCLLLAGASAALSWARLAKNAGSPPSDTAAQRSRFMLELGMGMSILFALVIAFYIVPVFLLSSCPT